MDEGSDEPFLLEADQGDVLTGAVSRAEVAALLADVVSRPEAVGRSFEVRRGAGAEAKGRAMAPRDYLRLLLKLVPGERDGGAGRAPRSSVAGCVFAWRCACRACVCVRAAALAAAVQPRHVARKAVRAPRSRLRYRPGSTRPRPP